MNARGPSSAQAGDISREPSQLASRETSKSTTNTNGVGSLVSRTAQVGPSPLGMRRTPSNEQGGALPDMPFERAHWRSVSAGALSAVISEPSPSGSVARDSTVTGTVEFGADGGSVLAHAALGSTVSPTAGG